MKALLLRLVALRPERAIMRLSAALALLVAATAWVEWGMRRLDPVPGAAAVKPLLAPAADPRFALDARPGPGRVAVEDGIAVLESASEQGLVALYVHLAPLPELAGVHIAARLASASVRSARAPGAGARLWFFGRDREGRPVYGQGLELARLVGSREPFAFRRDVRLPPGSVGATLAIELVRARGRVEVGELVLWPLRERPLFRLARAAVVVGWLLAGGAGLVLLVTRLGAPLLAGALVASMGAAGLLLLMPAPLKSGFVQDLAAQLGLAPIEPELIGDLGHLLLFAALSSLAVATIRQFSLVSVLAFLALCALLGEYLQLLTDSRTADLADAVRNLLGVGLGALVGLALRRWPRRARTLVRREG